ncbi:MULTISPECIES: DEAD/DEAH box helicase family protein [unclassified Dehalobacter]|uniref:DEAD/DEAH box helicase family protein n=1 Tax=unclassified Dehalobacter TaxID=2635733 RepID=UPI000E6CE4A2|nr:MULTISPECIES: DEAD/DEAH box helicase family protein [unclassified Dehalobacter]RJE47460.1 competence protein ComF [Dehalobacter sp. MCB1]TCX48728.1 DNA/RNA helicase [Dehalobacter sp. 14DCB1]TCX56224.1 DNA/RNA helicase [Dehalobacter sp. 12DCB1]
MLFYILAKDNEEFCFSPLPSAGLILGGWTRYLSPGLPLEKLLAITAELPDKKPTVQPVSAQPATPPFSPVLPSAPVINRDFENKLAQKLTKRMKKENMGVREKVWWQNISREALPEAFNIEVLQNETIYQKFLRMAEGRQLAENEFWIVEKELGVSTKELLGFMQKAVQSGNAAWLPIFEQVRSTYFCRRCGSSHYEEWPSLYGDTYTCLDCREIGPLNSLQILFRLHSVDVVGQTQMDTDKCEPDQTVRNYSLEFTFAQEKTAGELWQQVHRQKAKETLLWAACGAGKTEVCFPLIDSFLRQNKKVLFAAPRQDVVHDVQPRLQKNFLEYNIKILSGALPQDMEPSKLTVATTHQVLRFYQAFHLIILDETDAYPYEGSSVLEYGIRQALRPDGQIICLTATPSAKILSRVKSRECTIVRLPARHHGFPVPVPEWQKNRLTGDRSVVKLKKILLELITDGPILVFVPTVALVKEWTGVLKTAFGDLCVEGSWSSDAARRKKTVLFRQGDIDIFVCTSILERGITIKGVQVAVLFADHALYDARALVQMAGRTGRSAECPVGRAVFIYAKQTRAMIEANRWIQDQNRLAEEWGCLNG